MRYALALVVIIAMTAGSAFAVGNPLVSIWLDADPPNAITSVTPDVGGFFTVTLVMECFGDDPVLSGTRGLGVLGVRTFSGIKLSQTSLLGGLDFGDFEVDGWTLVPTDCIFPTNGYVPMGEIQYLYQGAPGTLTLQPHPGSGRESLDCEFNFDDLYCIAGGLGVHDTAPGNTEECVCDSPVDAASWGLIKALYR